MIKSTRIFLTVITLFIFSVQQLYCQKRNNVWCFGDSTGIDFNGTTATTFTTSMDSRGSSCSIADTNGNLLFYANTRATLPGYTTQVWNRNHQLMQNGDSIAGRGWYNELVIVPYPGSSNKYYLFCNSTTSIYGLYYSIIDMSFDNGLGAVVEKNVLLGNDTLCDAMTAIKHGNGVDWWLIVKKTSIAGDNTFYEYLISSDTILKSTLYAGGLSSTNAGYLGASINGDILYFVNSVGLIELFNFERCLGILTNTTIVRYENFNNIPLYSGAALSPNSEYLYVSDAKDTFHLFQFDLATSNIWNSRDTLAVIDYAQGGGGNLRLAPDNKIYWSCEWGPAGWFPYPYQSFMYSPYNMNLSVINNPDVQGSGCNLDLFSFYLGGKRTYWGLPNNPDYEMGALHGSICDSLSIGIEEVETSNLISVYPNPASNYFTVHLKFIPENDFKLQLTDLTGRVLLQFPVAKGIDQFPVNCENLESGSYNIRLYTSDKLISQQKVIITK